MSAFYFLPRERERRGQVTFNVLIFHSFVGLLGCLALVLRPTLLVVFVGSHDLVPFATQIGIVVLLWVATSSLEYIAVANQEIKLATILIVSLQLSRTLAFLLAAILFASVKSLIYAAIVQGLLQAGVLITYLSIRFRIFHDGWNWEMLKRQTSYALPLGFAVLLYAIQLDVHNYFISHQFGPTAFAIYAIGCFQLPFIHILSDSVGSVMIPRVNVLQKQNERLEIIKLTARMMRKLAFAYFALYAFLLIAGREFITLLFTTRYLASWPIFEINLAMILLYFIANAYDPVMRAYAEHRYFLLRVRAVLLTLLLLILWFFTEKLGMIGVISMVVFFNAVERLTSALKAGNILGFKRENLTYFKDVGKLAVAAAFAAAVTAFVRALVLDGKPFVTLLFCGFTFVAAYLGLIFLLRIVTPDERKSFQSHLIHLLRRFSGRRTADSLT
jgi:O-antigen/teichoic acid export membrane protein